MSNLTKILIKELRKIADNLEAETCQLSNDEVMDIVNMLTHEAISKEEACKFLNVSRATFDLHVSYGNIPKGRKRLGFKELVWYKDELQQCVDRLRR